MPIRVYTEEEEGQLRQAANDSGFSVLDLKMIIEGEEHFTPVPYTTYGNGELPPKNRHERRAAAAQARKKGHQ